jgi:biotin/methionine sulfoxide reductase
LLHELPFQTKVVKLCMAFCADVVRIYSARGSCLAGAVLTDAVRPGVLRLSCGAWYDPAESDDTAICIHGNANILTRDHGTSKLGQGPTCATTLVDVERWLGSVPPIRAFQPPSFAT